MLGCTIRCDAFVDGASAPKDQTCSPKTVAICLVSQCPASSGQAPEIPLALPPLQQITDHGKVRPSPRERGRKGPAANQSTVLAAHRARTPCHRSSESHPCPTFFPRTPNTGLSLAVTCPPFAGLHLNRHRNARTRFDGLLGGQRVTMSACMESSTLLGGCLGGRSLLWGMLHSNSRPALMHASQSMVTLVVAQADDMLAVLWARGSWPSHWVKSFGALIRDVLAGACLHGACCQSCGVAGYHNQEAHSFRCGIESIPQPPLPAPSRGECQDPTKHEYFRTSGLLSSSPTPREVAATASGSHVRTLPAARVSRSLVRPRGLR